MKNNLKKYSLLFVFIASTIGGSLSAQKKDVPDSVKVKEGDRNVMLNASNNTGPRDVNIGLPASVGGTTVLENGLPVVYFFWPELPTRAWRMDATTNKVKLYDLGQTAINIGDVGFSVGTYNNFGSDKFQGNGSLNSNHFGLIRGDINISSPIGKNGLKFTAGAYVSFDPGTFDAKGLSNYYSDKTQLYKFGLTQDYKLEGLTGSITAFYKYANVEGLRQSYAPFIYKKDGKVKELSGFKMGSDSYYETSGKITLQDAFTGKFVERDILKDYGSESHTLDLIWKNKLDNGLEINFIGRYHKAKTGNFLPLMTGVFDPNDEKNEKGERNTRYTYEDGTAYNGDHYQGVLILASKRTPIQSFTSTLEIKKISGNHDWTLGLNQWNYNIDKFASEGVTYNQEVKADPKKLIRYKYNDVNHIWEKEANEYGNKFSSLEYHNGSENKTAVFFVDKWKVTNLLDLNLGARLEYQTLNGDYQDRDAIDPLTKEKYTHLNGPKTAINKSWWNKAFMISGVYKMTRKFGILAEATYNEQGGHIENYSIGNDPHIKKSKIPEGGLGVYFNHLSPGASFLPSLSLVSKATYIKRDEYRSTVNFSNPTTGEVKRETTSYDIQTIGWTTDVVATLFKGFDLHMLLTIQSPKYKNFTGKVKWEPKAGETGETTYTDYDFSDKVVTGVSKVLIEIDPSYTWKDLRVWASARYFSKQYINKPNTLELEGHWETFAGASYKINKYLDANVSFVNLLNQRGASGSIPDGDLLLTNEDAKKKEGTIMSGTYIRPFTVEFGVKYRF